LALLPQVLVAYKFLSDEKEGLIRGTLTTASALGQSELSAVKSALGMFMGQQVELTVKVDQSIIGGLVARLGDLVIDGSVRTQLDNLGRSLIPD
jgi:F-type H+-transporting ATPase subunit delta